MRMIPAAVVCCALPGLPALAQTPPPETVFTAVAPCRALLTPTKIPANTSRLVQIVGSGFGSQGGPTGGCGVPASATAVAMSFTAYGASSPGYLTAYAAGAARPGVTTVSYPVNGAATAGTIVQLGDQGRISLFAAKDVTVAGEVTGYYAPQIRGTINLDGSIKYATSRIVSSTSTGTGAYSVTLDRNVTGCAASAAPFGAGSYIINAYPSGNTISAWAYRTTTGEAANIYWQFHVTC
jgi:hypothetical protein